MDWSPTHTASEAAGRPAPRLSRSAARQPRLAVVRNFGIHGGRPRFDAARQILEVGEPLLLEVEERLEAANAHVTVDHDLVLGVELGFAGLQLLQWNEFGAVDARDVPLPLFADV